ncbi:MAG: ArsR/SmtB family transcription factor [Sphaerochaeta sp.]|uniref:ArsR/SmtB family transcription factor n=1 Tax=Sphaerochaeta sp. TaxID=1972642 RepID=UPI002FC64EDF
MDSEQLILILKALSDSNRLAIFLKLTEGEACVCELLKVFSITQGTLSHHMRILSEADLVVGRRDGKWIHYAVNTATFSAFQTYIGSITFTTDPLEACPCV